METSASMCNTKLGGEKKIAKTYAQRQKEYRMRKKIEKERLCPKRKPKTNAERQQQFRQNQKKIQQIEALNSNLASESIKTITTELQLTRSEKKTNAQKCKEYRERKKLEIVRVPKTNAQRAKEYRERQKIKKQIELQQKNTDPLQRTAKTPAEYMRRYRQKLKLKKQDTQSNALLAKDDLVISPIPPSLHDEWLQNVASEAWKPTQNVVSCSKHFPVESPYVPPSGEHILQMDTMPLVEDIVKCEFPILQCRVKVCRICFATDCKLYSMAEYSNLNESYETLTGLVTENEENLPPYLCAVCAHRLLNCARFRTASLRAHLLLLDVLKKHDCITLETIKSINSNQLINSSLGVNYKTDHYDLNIVHVKKDILMDESDVGDMCDDGPPITNNKIVVKIETCDDEDTNKHEVNYVPGLHEELVLENVKMEYDYADSRINDDRNISNTSSFVPVPSLTLDKVKVNDINLSTNHLINVKIEPADAQYDNYICKKAFSDNKNINNEQTKVESDEINIDANRLKNVNIQTLIDLDDGPVAIYVKEEREAMVNEDSLNNENASDKNEMYLPTFRDTCALGFMEANSESVSNKDSFDHEYSYNSSMRNDVTVVSKKPKTNAEKCKDYYKRNQEEKRKRAAERVRAHRLRQKIILQQNTSSAAGPDVILN